MSCGLIGWNRALDILLPVNGNWVPPTWIWRGRLAGSAGHRGIAQGSLSQLEAENWWLLFFSDTCSILRRTGSWLCGICTTTRESPAVAQRVTPIFSRSDIYICIKVWAISIDWLISALDKNHIILHKSKLHQVDQVGSGFHVPCSCFQGVEHSHEFLSSVPYSVMVAHLPVTGCVHVRAQGHARRNWVRSLLLKMTFLGRLV